MKSNQNQPSYLSLQDLANDAKAIMKKHKLDGYELNVGVESTEVLKVQKKNNKFWVRLSKQDFETVASGWGKTKEQALLKFEVDILERTTDTGCVFDKIIVP